MFNYVMVEYPNKHIACASTGYPTFAECVELVRIITENNKTVTNVWIETSETELMEA
jgi:hypothetical protein